MAKAVEVSEPSVKGRLPLPGDPPITPEDEEEVATNPAIVRSDR